MDNQELPTDITLQKTADALTARNFEGIIVDNKQEALEKIISLIPAGVSVQMGTSKTMDQIGFTDYLKSNAHGWDNLRGKIVAEKDPAKQSLMRKQATIADFYVGSVHALTQDGEFLIASGSGSQIPAIAYNAKNLIFVVGWQKIVVDLPAAFKRLNKIVIPLEDQRIKQVMGPDKSTMLARTLIMRRESPAYGRKIRVILVKEALGF